MADGVTRGSSILTNSAWMVGSRLIVAAIQWFTTLLIIRHLSVDDFGLFSLVFGILGMLSIVTDMGLGRAAVTLLLGPETDRARATGAYITLRTALGLLGYVLALGVVALGGYGETTLVAAAVGAVSVVLATVSSAHTVVFQVHERLQVPAMSRVVGVGSQFLVVVALIQGDHSVVLYMLPAVIAAAVEAVITTVGAHRMGPIRYVVDTSLWWHLLREAVPISVGQAMTTLYYRIDVVMLSQLATLAAVATYSVAYKFVDILQIVPLSMTTAALPVLVGHWSHDRQAFQRVGMQVCRALAVTGSLVAAGFLVLADHVVPLLYGQDYADSAGVAKIVVVSQCLSFAAAAALLLLTGAGRHHRFPWIATSGLVFNVAVNLYAIPRFSYTGAAWATLATDLLMSALMWREVQRTGVFDTSELRSLWRAVVTGVVAGIIGWLASAQWSWIVGAIALLLSFAAGVLLTRALGPDMRLIPRLR